VKRDIIQRLSYKYKILLNSQLCLLMVEQYIKGVIHSFVIEPTTCIKSLFLSARSAIVPPTAITL
jgi:hypothetical protein